MCANENITEKEGQCKYVNIAIELKKVNGTESSQALN